jgi:hypothetical protein
MGRVRAYPASVIMPQRRGTVNHVSKTTPPKKALSSPRSPLTSLYSPLSRLTIAPPPDMLTEVVLHHDGAPNDVRTSFAFAVGLPGRHSRK